jgi:PAS domain S-box-containing protein
VPHHILSRGVPVEDESGAVTSWVGINLDITKLKAAETSLKELNANLEQRVTERSAAAEERAIALAASEKELRHHTLVMHSIINSMGEGVIVANAEGKIVLCNQAAEDLFEIGSGETISESSSETYGLFLLDGRTPMPVQDLPLVGALRGESCDEIEMFVLRPPKTSGTLISVTGRPIRTADGTIRGGVVVFRDITSRKETLELLRESEERFRTAFEFAAIGMGLVALDGRWLRVNRSLCDLLGYSERELLDTDFQSITHADDLADDLNHAGRLLAGEIRTYQMEKRYTHKAGHLVSILLSGSLVRNAAGEPQYFIAQIHDLTRQKAAEEERRQSLLRTRFVEQTMSAREHEQRRIARDLHDGVGQTLTSLRLGLRVIEEAGDLKTAQAAAGELRRMVVSALDEVRIMTRSLRPRVLDDLGLTPAIARLADDFMSTNLSVIRLDVAAIEGVRFPELVETALYRIVQEALTNVAKHAAAKLVRIELSRQGANLRLKIDDDGVGFDPAAQIDVTRCFGITGMRERISLLNGDFALTAGKNGGTTIEASIPLQTEASE